MNARFIAEPRRLLVFYYAATLVALIMNMALRSMIVTLTRNPSELRRTSSKFREFSPIVPF